MLLLVQSASFSQKDLNLKSGFKPLVSVGPWMLLKMCEHILFHV